MHGTSINISPKVLPKAVLGWSGGHLGSKTGPNAKKPRKVCSQTPSPGAKSGVKIGEKQLSDVFFGTEEHADKKNLEEFASGNLKCIINCKKLNEGINMKTLSNIILVSSESKRQLIQRLGRVLRIDEENQPNKRAFVIDFIENKQLENMDGADYTRYTYLNELSKIKKLN